MTETTTNQAAKQLVSSTQSPSKAPLSSASFFSDPTYSGMGTWLGTILSILAAIVAWRQARKAATAVEKLKMEQGRQYLENTRKHMERVNQHLTPLIHRTYQRGVKSKPLLDSARLECHEALSLPIDKKIQTSIEKIQNYLDKYPSVENNDVSRDDLNALIRNEIQATLRSCSGDIDTIAAQPQ